MTWNLRIMEHKEKIDGKVYTYYAVHEIFYNKNGKPISWTKEPIDLIGETVKDLMQYLNLILKDCRRFKKDILKYK